MICPGGAHKHVDHCLSLGPYKRLSGGGLTLPLPSLFDPRGMMMVVDGQAGPISEQDQYYCHKQHRHWDSSQPPDEIRLIVTDVDG